MCKKCPICESKLRIGLPVTTSRDGIFKITAKINYCCVEPGCSFKDFSVLPWQLKNFTSKTSVI